MTLYKHLSMVAQLELCLDEADSLPLLNSLIERLGGTPDYDKSEHVIYQRVTGWLGEDFTNGLEGNLQNELQEML